MPDTTPADEANILSPKSQAIWRDILLHSRDEQERLWKKWNYQEAMRVHEDQEEQLRKLDRQLKRKSS